MINCPQRMRTMGTKSTITVGGRPSTVKEWTFLEQRPHVWKRELCLKGRRVRAGVVYSSMVANHRTREETATAWNLPLEAINEVVRYCEANRALIAAENQREKLVAETAGSLLEPPIT